LNYLFFDIECANCFRGNGKICSFGYVLTDNEFNILEKRDIVINPHAKFFLKGTESHPGISLAYDEKVFFQSPDFNYYYNEIRNLLQKDDTTIFGFSTMSDANFIVSECKRFHRMIFDFDFIDVQRIFADYFELENTPSLVKCINEFNIEENQDIHKSDDDALFTMYVLRGICERTGLRADELIEKYPYCKCWLRDGILDSEYLHFKLLQKRAKLSKMEQLTNSKKDNWMHTNDNDIKFKNTFHKLFINYKSTFPLKGNRVCFSYIYEEYHYQEMVNIVKHLAKLGVKYTQKFFLCDFYIDYSISTETKKYTCQRLDKIKKAKYHNIYNNTIKVLSLDSFFNMCGIDDEVLKGII